MDRFIILDADGAPVSIGTVLADPLPVGLTAVPLTDAEYRDTQALFARNFGHEDRYVMPLKSSV